MTCGSLDAFEAGKVAMTTLPVPDAKYVPGKQPEVGAGAGKVQGVVPDGFERVVGVDAAGDQLAATAVVDNVYELVVPSFRELWVVWLTRREGRTTTLPLGPDR